MRNDEPISDEALVESSRGGDTRAFRTLVERYESRVAATVVGMLGPTDEAEDVGQETFVRFYRSLDRFRGDASVATYLTRIAINQSLTALRKRRRWRERFVSRDEVQGRGLEPVVDTGDDVETSDRAAIVRRAIRDLSPDHRAVVVLRMIEGYSTIETAEILEVPTGTVTSRLSRALDRLESELAPILLAG